MNTSHLNRRDALRKLAMGGIGAAAAPLWVQKLNVVALAHTHSHQKAAAAGETDSWSPKFLNSKQNELVVTLSELIIPQTDTPGAKAAKVNEFVDAVLDDADNNEKREFKRGLRWIDSRSNELFGADFVQATPEQQTALLTIISSRSNKALEDQIGIEFFNAIKSLTITGYYTSEVGMKEELGDDGNLFFEDYPGCTHPEHKA